MQDEWRECECAPIDDENDDNEIYNNIDKKESSSEEKEIIIEAKFNFNEFILSHEVIEGNWNKDSQCEILIELEKDFKKKLRNIQKIKK